MIFNKLIVKLLLYLLFPTFAPQGNLEDGRLTNVREMGRFHYLFPQKSHCADVGVSG